MEQGIDKRFLKNQSGAVAATYALALIPLIAIIGLGFDYTRVAGMDTELQNAADQAALAGATQLDRTAGSMERAIAAAQGGLVQNSTLFSNDGVGNTIAVTDAGTQVIFYATRADAEAGTNGFTDVSRFAEAGYVQVTVDTRASNYALTPVVGALQGSLNGSAVAGMGSALCRVPPLMICNPDETNIGSGGNANAKFDGAARRGTGMKVVEGPTGGGPSYWKPGDYGFLDLGAGADAVAKGLGWITPDGGCYGLEGNETIAPDTEPGLKTGAIDSINTRFDIYQTSSTCKTPGQCPAALNVRKDMVRAANTTPPTGTNACKIHNQGWQEVLSGDRYLPSTNAPLPTTTTPASMGHPRDICHAVSSAGVCTGVKAGDSDKFGDGIWDRNAYFRSHYKRSVATAYGGVGSSWQEADWKRELAGEAAAGINNITRYEVYLWEIKNAGGPAVDGVFVLREYPYLAAGSTLVEHGEPICSQQEGYGPGIADPDRRVMTVAVVNCEAEQVRGKTKDVEIANWIDVFVVQPSADRDRTAKSDIYMEVIRENLVQNTGTVGGLLIRRDVPYLLK